MYVATTETGLRDGRFVRCLGWGHDHGLPFARKVRSGRERGRMAKSQEARQQAVLLQRGHFRQLVNDAPRTFDVAQPRFVILKHSLSWRRRQRRNTQMAACIAFSWLRRHLRGQNRTTSGEQDRDAMHR